jgi:hypothetical protein
MQIIARHAVYPRQQNCHKSGGNLGALPSNKWARLRSSKPKKCRQTSKLLGVQSPPITITVHLGHRLKFLSFVVEKSQGTTTSLLLLSNPKTKSTRTTLGKRRTGTLLLLLWQVLLVLLIDVPGNP